MAQTRQFGRCALTMLALLGGLLACGIPTVLPPVSPCDEASLRTAIDTASAGAVADVSPSAACTIHLSSPLVIKKSLTLRMPGPSVTLDGGGSVQVFSITGSTPTIFNLQGFTIAHGFSSNGGGGLDDHGQTVNVSNSTFLNNTVTGDASTGSHGGGAIANQFGGKLTITDSHFIGNAAGGQGALAAPCSVLVAATPT